MESRRITVGDRTWTVRVGGPESRHHVLLLPDAGDPADVYDEVCARLQTSDLHTIVIEPADGLDTAAVFGILDQLKVPWANLVGCGAGAELAWQLAARGFGRFMSVIVAGRGHPATPDVNGDIADPACPPVEIPATLLATKGFPRELAEPSGRHVYGEFRLVSVDVADVAAEAGNELATEIVLRTSFW
ncbi:alpha/beta fold hydrolase [Nocardia huaxiensis]|uniref:Alpha/beta hydrolase n=1 Tax=Nocardia huaxiensis TaxID=2755382 RepID=A0A7D6VAR3_9NOCA|nr:alpha/beta hydrolase [Nocardia huaxiensis]QLY29782.1 alpha/beta hydrolase [Nocardia huaxiensis]UFS96631.1 alpha/beta hydrolase [Nocardia huaxiensis]